MTQIEDTSHIVKTILAFAEARPDSLCMDYDDRALNYGELRTKIFQWAAAFRGDGIALGDCVGVVQRDLIDDITARLALMAMGAVPASLDVFSKPADRGTTMERYGLKYVIEDEASFSGLAQSILLDAAWVERAEALPIEPQVENAPEGVAQMIFSSGTSGVPVGAFQTHSTVELMGEVLVAPLQGETMRMLSAVWHSAPAGAILPLMALIKGGSLFLRPILGDHKSMMSALQETESNYMFMPPNMLADMIATAKERGVAPTLPKLSCLLVGSAASSPALLREAADWLTPGVVQAYGSGPAGVIALQTREDFMAKPGSVGRVCKGVEVEIVNEDDQPEPYGTIGRLRLRSAMVTTRLLGETRTQADRRSGTWLYPGDLAILDENGFLFILGREGELINRGGVKIYPIEIENALLRCPGVKEVALVGAPSEKDGQQPVAFVVASPDVNTTDLETFGRKVLPTSKRPVRYILLPALPRNQGNKVVKRELIEGLTNGRY